jgi:large subunit ribosomal protein L9
MKIILTQAVPGLGEAGTIKDVADGYARNFLLPRKMAIAATKNTLKQAEEQAEMYARKANKARSALESSAAAIEGKVVTIRARAGSENRLYGSITSGDLADALQAQYGITLDRRKIEIEPIHRLGTYTATADIGSGVTATFSVEVAPEVAGAHGKATRAAASTEAAPAETAGDDTASQAAEAPETESEMEAESEANPS